MSMSMLLHSFFKDISWLKQHELTTSLLATTSPLHQVIYENSTLSPTYKIPIDVLPRHIQRAFKLRRIHAIPMWYREKIRIIDSYTLQQQSIQQQQMLMQPTDATMSTTSA